MDAAGALNPKMLLPVLVIAGVVEKILLPVLAIDKDVPPKILLPVPVVADVPPKIPLPVFFTVENVLLKKLLPEFVMVEDVPLKLLFPELVLLTVLSVTAGVPPKILLPELVKADALPKGTMATLPELVSWFLASVASPEVADNVETDVDGSLEDANLKTGAAVKEGTETSIEGLFVLLTVTLAVVEVVAAAEVSLLVVKDI